MSRSHLPGVEQCSPAHCLEILRIFSRTNNGEATVMLMLRHIAQLLATSRAAVVLSQALPGTKQNSVALGGYDPLRKKTAGSGDLCCRLPIEKDGSKIWFFDETGKYGNMSVDEIAPDLEILAMVLEKWQDEKLLLLEEKRHERLEKRLKRQNRFLNSLHRVALDIVNHKDYDALMSTILRHAQNILSANFSAIYILNEARSLLEMKYLGDGVDQSILGLSLAKGQGGAGKSWETGEFLVINDYPHWGNRVRLSWLDGVGTIAFMPLGSVEELVGIICLGFPESTRKVTLAEKALLQQFANLAH